MTSQNNSGQDRTEPSEWTPLAGFGICTTYLIFLIATHLREGGAAMTLPHESGVLDFALIPARSLGLLGAYLLTSCFCGMFLLLWMKQTLRCVPRRAVGLPLLVLALSSLVALIEGGSSVWGGLFGEMLRDAYEMVLPRPLAYLVAVALVSFGLVMARDWFFFDEIRRILTNQPASPAFALGIGSEGSEIGDVDVKTVPKSRKRTEKNETPAFDLGGPISMSATAELLAPEGRIQSLGTSVPIIDDLDLVVEESTVELQSGKNKTAVEATAVQETEAETGVGYDFGAVQDAVVTTEESIVEEAAASEGTGFISNHDDDLASFLDDDDELDSLDPIPTLDWSSPISENSDVDLFGAIESAEEEDVAAELMTDVEMQDVVTAVDHPAVVEESEALEVETEFAEEEEDEEFESYDFDEDEDEEFEAEDEFDEDDDDEEDEEDAEIELAADDLLYEDDLDDEELEEEDVDLEYEEETDEEELEDEDEELEFDADDEFDLSDESEDEESDDDVLMKDSDEFEEELDDETDAAFDGESEATEPVVVLEEKAVPEGPSEFGPDTQALLETDIDELFEEDEELMYEVEDYSNKVVEANESEDDAGVGQVDYEATAPTSFHEDDLDAMEDDLVEDPEEVEIQHLLFGEEDHIRVTAKPAPALELPDEEAVSYVQSTLPDDEKTDAKVKLEAVEEPSEVSELERYGAAEAVIPNELRPVASKEDDWAPWGEDSAPPRPANLAEMAESPEPEIPESDSLASKVEEDEIDWIGEAHDSETEAEVDSSAEIKISEEIDFLDDPEPEELTNISESAEVAINEDSDAAEEIDEGLDDLVTEPKETAETVPEADSATESEVSAETTIPVESVEVQAGALEFPFENLGEDFYHDAVGLCLQQDSCRISFLQRNLSIDFAQAAAVVERMEAEGLVGPYSGSGSHEILVNYDDWRAGRM